YRSDEEIVSGRSLVEVKAEVNLEPHFTQPVCCDPLHGSYANASRCPSSGLRFARMNNSSLLLSSESGFQSDWKAPYHKDAQFWAANEYDTDSIMKAIAEMVGHIAQQFNLSPEMEFTVVDTMELLFVRAFKSCVQQQPGTSALPDAVDRKMDTFMRQLPIYTVAVIDIVAKYVKIGTKLDLVALKRVAKVRNGGSNMLAAEFDVIKLLDTEVHSSLLLGAVERFSMHYLLPLNVAGKETVGQIGIKLLRFTIAERALIYNSLKTSVRNPNCFRRFKTNKLILAGAIVLGVLYLLPGAHHSKTILDQVIQPLANDCCVQESNLIYLRDAILRAIDGR
uniref:Uncharacterized protein n=1 Tax=Anopheles dirus TaxID=7168 RepID=A0A182NTK9_9DIPT